VFFGVYLIAVAVLMGMARFRRLVLPGVLGALTVVAGGGLVVPEFGIIGAAWVRLAGFGVMAVAAGWATYGELRSRATL
jgi:O-antigen/teichoic acid export membrane protein